MVISCVTINQTTRRRPAVKSQDVVNWVKIMQKAQYDYFYFTLSTVVIQAIVESEQISVIPAQAWMKI